MKDYRLYFGRQSLISGVPEIREMLDTVKEDLPEYDLFQVVDSPLFTLSGTIQYRYLVMVKNI